MQAPAVDAAALSGWAEHRSRHHTVPLAEFVKLTESVARGAGDDLLGWTLGTQYDLRQIGPLGTAILTAPTLGAALRRFVDYFSLMQDASELALRSEEGGLTVAYRILDPEIWPRQQDAIFTLGIVSQVVRAAVGAQWEKVQIGVECQDVERATRLSLRAGAACTASADSNWLRIPAGLAALPLPRSERQCGADLRLLSRLLVQKSRETDIDSRVRTLVYRLLGDRPISQEGIARELGMSSRTLRRHLAASSTSFQEVMDECRLRQAAHEFKVKRDASIAQTALRLGYSEHSTFTRAFSRWSGMSPQSFIRANRFQPGGPARSDHHRYETMAP
jgi:AraC-like DNA-binding protein